MSAVEAVTALRAAGHSVATAESLTGGLVCAALVAVPGASDVVRGGVVAYTARAKVDVLGVDPDLVARRGTVDAEVAAAMAVAAARSFDADWGLATTGVAGPSPSEGKPVGTVHVAVSGPDGVRTRQLALSGDREAIRHATVADVLSWLVDRVEEESR